ncbi:histone-lysine N-methyltransferase SETMAR [Trichonephila clavipes]|nr:histone-lysine N-methyltransferase SETMAR [Trichonephila clavipes]
MDKIEYRVIVKYLFLKGNAPTQIKVELDSVYGDSTPSFTSVKVWAAEFKRGRKSLGDDKRSGRLNTATTDETIAKVHQMGLDNRRIKVREIAEVMIMSKEHVCHILNQHLGIRKLSMRWVPCLLTLDQKHVRMNISNALLPQFRCNKSKFYYRLITVDETWIHHYTPETKIQCKQWTAKGEPAPKKAKTVYSAGKVMETVFWDRHGVILIDYLQKGKTITGFLLRITNHYYASLLDKLKAELAKKRPHLQKKKIMYHQDNAPSHTSAVAMTKIHELRFELLDHPPYSPDLAPSNFFLSSHLKIALGGQRFSSNEEAITFVSNYFAEKKRRVLFGRVTEMGASLGEVCRIIRRLC